MPDWFIALGAVPQAFLATSFTWFVTALGAAVEGTSVSVPLRREGMSRSRAFF